MDNKHRDSLIRNRLIFTEDLEAKDVTGYLYQNRILRENDVELIHAEKTRISRTELLLDTLPRKGKHAYSAFRNALLSAGMIHLSDSLIDVELEQSTTTDVVDAGFPKVDNETHLSDHYRMIHSPRGWCLILNNVKFIDYTLSDRTGSDVDANNLEAVFRSMDFNTWIVNDASAEKMLAVCKTLSEDKCDKNCDCVIVCILSHGSSDGIYGIDGEIITVDELVNPFATNNILKDVPKMFVIQACRADSALQKTTNTDSSSIQNNAHGVIREKEKLMLNNPDKIVDISLPLSKSLANQQRHLVLAYCAFPGSVAYRNLDHGSWYINALVETFNDSSSKMGILDILTTVNRKLSLKMTENKDIFQVPAPLFTLDKKLILNPRN